MQKKKGLIDVTVCDICGDVLKSMRASGYQNYTDYEFDVCSNCCATPEVHEGETTKAKFLMKFHKRSNGLEKGIPPFWPKNSLGEALSIDHIAAIAA